ncbi:MAG: HAMP domain-containing protein [Gammaproteobacteria bacterium]|nr:HAMP domain-containing protein [Gammaproteobacteria bacterium]
MTRSRSPVPRSPAPGLPNLGLRARLVIIMILMAVTVVVLDTTLTRWAFQSRFLSYVNEQEREVVERLAEQLAEAHAEFGDWRALDSRRNLARLLMRNLSEDAVIDVRTGPPRPELRDDLREGLRENLRTTRMLLPRLHVLDAQGQQVAGPREALPTDPSPFFAPVVVDGVEVGRVALTPLHSLAREADQRFVRDHMRTLWWIALIAVILASLVGIALGRHLLAPVRAVAAGARELAAGQYGTRLTVDRSDELGSLARDFNLLAAGLEANRESRRRWLADIAHELRTPLAVLRAEIEALRDGVRSLDHEAMAALAAEAERLGHLVDDLHQLALADAGALSYHFADIDPMALLESTAQRYQARLQAAGLSLELVLPATAPILFADAERLEQLLANLLENSLRYTDAPGTVRLSLDSDQDGAELRIQVDDSAPGVPEAEIPRLFERFARREASRDRASGGSGLGLAIARRIAEAHGGHLEGAPSELGGLRMTVTLARRPAPETVVSA